MRKLFLLAFAASLCCVFFIKSADAVQSPFLRHFTIVRDGGTQEKVVALTYDDGPNPIFTPEILKILDKHGVKATFFLIGSMMEKYPKLTREISANGHVIANHTYSHPHDLRLLKRDSIEEEIERCNQTVEKLTGKRPMLFRSPRGVVDSTVMDVVEQKNLKMVLWSVSADNHGAPTPELMMQRVARLIKPGGIVLMHDGTFYTRWKDVLATELIIVNLKKRGYRFVTLPEMLRIRDRNLKNLLISRDKKLLSGR